MGPICMRWDMRGVGAQKCGAAELVVLTSGVWLEGGEVEEGGREAADWMRRGVARGVSEVELKGRADCCGRSSALGGATGAEKSPVPAAGDSTVSGCWGSGAMGFSLPTGATDTLPPSAALGGNLAA